MSSSTSGGYSRQLRLFLSRHKTLNNSDGNDAKAKTSKNKKKQNKYQKKALISVNNSQTDNNYCDNSSENRRLSLNANRVCVQLLSLPQNHSPPKPRVHRRSYSLNDITVLIECFDLCTTSSESKTRDKCSKFKRTLSYFSGKSFIRKKDKLKNETMGQSSSTNSMEPVSTVSSGGQSHKGDKTKDVTNIGEFNIPYYPTNPYSSHLYLHAVIPQGIPSYGQLIPIPV